MHYDHPLRWHTEEVSLTSTTAPATGVVTLALVKAALNISHSDDDTYLGHLINVASGMLDGPRSMTGQCYVNQSWKVSLRDPEERIYLAGTNVSSVDSITYLDGNGDAQTFSTSSVTLHEDASGVFYVQCNVGSQWPSGLLDRPNALQVTYTAGLGPDETTVPSRVAHAAILLVGHYFENREAVTLSTNANVPKELVLGVDALLEGEKVGWIGS